MCLFFRYSERNLSSPIKASLHFSLSRSGVFSLDRADAVIEISEWVEVPKKKLTVENSTSAFPNITVEGSPQNVSEEATENLINEGGLNITDASEDNQNKTDLVTEKKLKKRTFRIPLKVRNKHLNFSLCVNLFFLLNPFHQLD